MVITVQFKDRNKNFCGKTYDYILHGEEKLPKNGAIIRMMDSEYNYICNGTRVRVESVRHTSVSDMLKLSTIRYITSTMEE